MKLHLRYWLAAIAIALLMAYVGPDDGAQVIADDKNETIQQARVAAKD
jgi:hypothetical protein